ENRRVRPCRRRKEAAPRFSALEVPPMEAHTNPTSHQGIPQYQATSRGQRVVSGEWSVGKCAQFSRIGRVVALQPTMAECRIQKASGQAIGANFECPVLRRQACRDHIATSVVKYAYGDFSDEFRKKLPGVSGHGKRHFSPKKFPPTGPLSSDSRRN